MKDYRSKTIHALEFGCQAPLRFYEHCSACPRFGDDCPDLQLGIEVLRGRKKIGYTIDASGDEVPVSSFKCLAPLRYFEKSRMNCAHAGRCREEGLLLALLRGMKKLDYSLKPVIELPTRKPARAPVTKVEQAYPITK